MIKYLFNFRSLFWFVVFFMLFYLGAHKAPRITTITEELEIIVVSSIVGLIGAIGGAIQQYVSIKHKEKLKQKAQK